MLPKLEQGQDQVALQILQKEDQELLPLKRITCQKQSLTHRLQTHRAYQLIVTKPGTGLLESHFIRGTPSRGGPARLSVGGANISTITSNSMGLQRCPLCV